MFLSREQLRAVDRRAVEELGLPSEVLMENAGRGAADLLLSLGVRGPVVICCGKGNNGGDGLVIARHLDIRGATVRVLLFAPPEALRGDAAVNYRALSRTAVPLRALSEVEPAALADELASAEWVVDALFGTGLTGPLSAPFDRVAAAINASGARVLAVDIPSGLDCDTGEPLGPAVKAEHTVTFVAPKKGFASPGAAVWTGRVHVVGIGVPGSLIR
jgi:NAD(P)H-hydrate epimerase